MSLGRNLPVVPLVISSLFTLGRADYLCKKVVEQCVNNASDDYQTCEPFKFTVKGNNNYVKVAPVHPDGSHLRSFEWQFPANATGGICSKYVKYALPKGKDVNLLDPSNGEKLIFTCLANPSYDCPKMFLDRVYLSFYYNRYPSYFLEVKPKGPFNYHSFLVSDQRDIKFSNQLKEDTLRMSREIYDHMSELTKRSDIRICIDLAIDKFVSCKFVGLHQLVIAKIKEEGTIYVKFKIPTPPSIWTGLAQPDIQEKIKLRDVSDPTSKNDYGSVENRIKEITKGFERQINYSNQIIFGDLPYLQIILLSIGSLYLLLLLTHWYKNYP